MQFSRPGFRKLCAPRRAEIWQISGLCVLGLPRMPPLPRPARLGLPGSPPASLASWLAGGRAGMPGRRLLGPGWLARRLLGRPAGLAASPRPRHSRRSACGVENASPPACCLCSAASVALRLPLSGQESCACRSSDQEAGVPASLSLHCTAWAKQLMLMPSKSSHEHCRLPLSTKAEASTRTKTNTDANPRATYGYGYGRAPTLTKARRLPVLGLRRPCGGGRGTWAHPPEQPPATRVSPPL